MSQIQRHYVVTQSDDGGPLLHPMKQWLRDNPQWLPSDIDTKSSSSHELRRILRSQGWQLVMQPDRVLLLHPAQDQLTLSSTLTETADDEDEPTSDDLLQAEEVTFALEKDMQAALRKNIKQLDPRLSVIDGGKERVTEAGRIDITASDEDGTIVIIELKAGEAKPEAIAQVLSYMGAVSESDQKPVRGILIAGDFHARAVWAARAVSNLSLKKYTFQFSFNNIA